MKSLFVLAISFFVIASHAKANGSYGSYGSAGGYTYTVTKTTYGSAGGYSYGSSGGTATPTQVLPLPRPRAVIERLRSILKRNQTAVEIIEAPPAAAPNAVCQCGCDCPGCQCGMAAKKEEPPTAKK